MGNITLVATRHTENGKCNSKELLNILFAVNPDVIFEELSPHSYADIYEGRRADTLETATIKNYLHQNNSKHVPVDVDAMSLLDKELIDEITSMFSFFDGNIDYRNLRAELNKQSYLFGFPYLNSIQCETSLAKSYFLEQRLAAGHAERNLTKTHQIWIRIHDYREQQMISNIYKYHELYGVTNGIFLVGTEHRKPIIDLIKNVVPEKRLINWNLEYFANPK